MSNLNSFLFNVEKVSMLEKYGINTNSEYAYAVIGNINGEEKLLNCCSNVYELIPNSEIFPKIREVFNLHNISFTERYKSIDNVRFYADYVLTDTKFNIGANGDICQPLLRVRHSYNGKTKYAISFGYYRIICDNGLVVPIDNKLAQNLHIVGKHTEKINHSIDILFNRIQMFINNQNLYKQNFDILSKKVVEKPMERITEVLEFANIPVKNVEKVLSIVTNESNQLYNGVINDWLIYNGVNQLIDKGDNKKVLEQKELYDYKAIEFLLK